MECKRNKWNCEEGGSGGRFQKGKLFELLALTDTKLKGNGEVSWCGVNSIIGCFQEMERTREGVAILLNDVWHIGVVDFECFSSRIL